MALPDIITKIDAEACEQVRAIQDGAKQDVARIEAQTAAECARYEDQRYASAEKKAQQEANSILVGARMQARAEAGRARRRVFDQVFASVARKLASLETDQWVQVFAPRVAEAARAGERVLLGQRDAGRAERLRLALAQAGTDVVVTGEPAGFERGVLIVGERSYVDLSVAALAAQQKREMEPEVCRILFGNEEQDA